MTIHLLRLHTDKPFTHTGTHLRGAVIGAFPDREALHGHVEKPRFAPVRYVVHEGVPHVVGVGEGARELLDLYGGLESIPTPQGEYAVTGRELVQQPVEVGTVDQLHRYRGLSPWLGLNQRNHERFKTARGEGEQREVIRGALVGNLLAALKGVGVFLDRERERIMVSIESFQVRGQLRVGQTSFLDLRVRWTGNVIWTPWLGVGRQASKGFGRFTRDG